MTIPSLRSPTTITKLLVANRGEIAARVMRTAHDLGVSTVAVYSDPDADAPFVALADEAVRLPGATPAETYLRGDLVIAAARATGADAVHPGYGFLSENAGFARDCAAAGLTFVGPSPDAIASMGSKLEAKALMDGAPGCRCCRARPSPTRPTSATVADDIGFPVLVKAAFGGGGRGMRIVRVGRPTCVDAVDGARREAASAFGDGTVFLERFVEDPRHVEVQILGDSHGEVVHLFERECSIQRRYQKIVEEAPSPAVDDALRAELGAAAVAAGKAIGYTGAGTVEFVLATSDGGVLLPRGQHPAAGRAPGHRADHRARPGGAAAADRRGAAAAGRGDRRAHRRARDRGPALRRGRAGRATCPRRARCTGSRSPPCRACGSTPG